jgi:hypothetical protein
MLQKSVNDSSPEFVDDNAGVQQPTKILVLHKEACAASIDLKSIDDAMIKVCF